MITKNTKKKNENEELNNISCPICFSKLIFKSLNKNNQILACSNDECLFPLNNANMNKFIININDDNLTSFLINLRNLVLDQSYASDTNIEEKLKKYKDEKVEPQKDGFSDIVELKSFSNLLSQDDYNSN